MMIVPIIVVGVTNILYGYLAQQAPKPHWFGILFMYGATYFGFVVLTVSLISLYAK